MLVKYLSRSIKYVIILYVTFFAATTKRVPYDQGPLEEANHGSQRQVLFTKLLITNENVHPFSHGKFVIDSCQKGSAVMTIFLA